MNAFNITYYGRYWGYKSKQGRHLCLHSQVGVLSNVSNACMLIHFSCVRLFVTLWTVAHQVPLSMGFFRQEYWSGLPYSPLGDLPDPGIEPGSLISPALAGRFFTTSATWEAPIWVNLNNWYYSVLNYSILYWVIQKHVTRVPDLLVKILKKLFSTEVSFRLKHSSFL